MSQEKLEIYNNIIIQLYNNSQEKRGTYFYLIRNCEEIIFSNSQLMRSTR